MADISTKEYKKTLEDEIDWKIIDQLHSATSNFSTTSLGLKKLYFVLLGIAIPTLIKLAHDKLDTSFFVTMYLLTLTFWFLDSFTYFYQDKLREKMDTLFNQIKSRHTESLIVSEKEIKEYTIERTRTGKDRLWRSMANASIVLYFILFLLNTLAYIFHLLHFIL